MITDDKFSLANEIALILINPVTQWRGDLMKFRYSTARHCTDAPGVRRAVKAQYDVINSYVIQLEHLKSTFRSNGKMEM